jgi:hypothetical protein
MKTVSFKIIPYFILAIAILPLMFAGYIQVSEIIIHYEMKEELEQKNLVIIQIKSSQIIWTKKGKEAIVNGNMFDVEHYKANGDEIELTGLFDKDEDALFAKIDNCNSTNSNATGSTLVLKWFSCFLSVQKDNASNFFTAEKKSLGSTTQYIFFQSPFLSFDTPPPKSVI